MSVPGAAPPTILVIEDDDEVAVLLRELLAAEGYRVHVAYDGADGLRLARREHPDLITLDLGLPGKSGFQVLDELRRNPVTWDIPVFIMTAYTPEVLDQELRVPPEHFFAKPLELQRYLSSIAAAVGVKSYQ